MIKVLSPETIYSFKEVVDKSNKELDQLFESINSSFISSTNKNDKYKNIKFISHFKKSTNKWKKSLEDKSNSIKLLVKNSINKLSKDNFEKVTDELIFSLKINNYESLILLGNEIFNVILMHPVYLEFYLDLIVKIYYVTKDKWNFDSNNIINLLIDMAQIKYYLDYKEIDQLEDIVNPVLSDNMNFIELEGLSKEEMQIVEKSMKISNIKFLVKMYSLNFLDKKIFENLLQELIKLKTTDSMEALIEILSLCESNNPEILNNITKLNKLKDSNNFDFRLTFIYGEALQKFGSVKSNTKKKFSNKKPVKKKKVDTFMIGCENILEEYIMIEEFDEIKEYLKDSLNNYHELSKFSEVLIKTILCGKDDSQFTKLKNLIKSLTSNKMVKPSNFKKGMNNNLKNYNEIIIDYPKANKNLRKFISYSTKSNIIKKEFVDELINRYDIKIN